MVKTDKQNKKNKQDDQAEQQDLDKQQASIVKELQEKLEAAQEREKRSLADYQNLQRRTQSDRLQLIKFASKELIISLLPVLENLENAQAQIKDDGLEMIVQQLKQVLQQAGLEEFEVMNQKFDVNTMEAVQSYDDSEIVTEVIKKGYKFKGEVIQHAQVVLGHQQNKN